MRSFQSTRNYRPSLISIATDLRPLVCLKKTNHSHKRSHINELPENRDANLKILEQLHLQSQKINENIKAAEDRRLIIQSQLANMPYLSPSLAGSAGRGEWGSPAGVGQPPMVIQMSQLKNHLEDLQAKYTDNHPDIRVTKKKIADLEKKMADNRTGSEGSGKKGKNGDPVTDQYNYFQERKTHLSLLEKDIQRLKKEDEKVRTMIGTYQARIENTPIRELAMGAMLGEPPISMSPTRFCSRKAPKPNRRRTWNVVKKGNSFASSIRPGFPKNPLSRILSKCCSSDWP